MDPNPSPFSSIPAVQALFASDHCIADRPLALTLKLAADLHQPILLEGEAGVGKTEVAKVLARARHPAHSTAVLRRSRC